jgi:rhomboid family GlyGly-CTERM serine protease
LALVFGLGAWLLAGLPPASLDWQPGLALSQPWRAWTAALVHWSPSHWRMNAGGALLLALLGWRARVAPRDALAWLLAWPLTQAGLLLQPQLRHYAGLSGVLHAGVAIVVCRMLRSGAGRTRRVGLWLALGMLLKLLSEMPWRGAVQAVPGWDFALAPLAHVSGAVCGALCFLLCEWMARRAKAVRASAAPSP